LKRPVATARGTNPSRKALKVGCLGTRARVDASNCELIRSYLTSSLDAIPKKGLAFYLRVNDRQLFARGGWSLNAREEIRMETAKTRDDLLVLSGHTRPSSPAPINHRVYCDRHGYAYAFDSTPYAIRSVYDHKLRAVLANLNRSAWIAWFDDDTYFMNHEIELARFIPMEPLIDFVFCNSPIRADGSFTLINSGAFFVRNSATALATLTETLFADLGAVKTWWSIAEHGEFLNSDQEKFVYTFCRGGMFGKSVKVMKYLDFNARDYNFTVSFDQYFVLHLCNAHDKDAARRKVMERFNLDEYLLPAGSLAMAGGVPGNSIFTRGKRAPL
jgi:hypothetical protein